MHTRTTVAIYADPDYGVVNEFAAGLYALGYRTMWRRPDVFTPDQVEAFHAVVLNGLRGLNPRVAAAYRAKGVPVIITDLGYLNRPDGYHQVGLGRLNWIPPFKCPSDRFARLGVTLAPRRHGGKHILILGQMPGDAAHDLDEDTLRAMYRDWIAEIRRHTDLDVVYRPHPGRGVAIEAGEGVRLSSKAELAADLADAYAAVTHNSTAGLVALAAGVPVFCHPSALYAEIANTGGLVLGRPADFPDDTARAEFFARVGYAQWTRAEIASGDAVRFILDVAFGRHESNTTGEGIDAEPHEDEGQGQPQAQGGPAQDGPEAQAAAQVAPEPAPVKRGRGRPRTHGKYARKPAVAGDGAAAPASIDPFATPAAEAGDV